MLPTAPTSTPAVLNLPLSDDAIELTAAERERCRDYLPRLAAIRNSEINRQSHKILSLARALYQACENYGENFAHGAARKVLIAAGAKTPDPSSSEPWGDDTFDPAVEAVRGIEWTLAKFVETL